jgi:hypothetical protein
MSLKAYNGMMTKKGLKFLQDKIKENLHLFKEASERQVLKAYVGAILHKTDKNNSMFNYFRFAAINEDKIVGELEEIKLDDITNLSLLYQAGKILTNGYFVNDFCVHLNLTLECVKTNKILVYPNLLVPEHEGILLSFLTDWYAQNQCDPDENVPKREWNQRCRDWNSFNETRGYQQKIILFDPQDFYGIVKNLRGEDLVKGIIANIPSDEKRKEKILRNKFIDNLTNRFKAESKDLVMGSYHLAMNYFKSKEGETEFEEFKKNTPIELVTIDEEFLKKKYND